MSKATTTTGTVKVCGYVRVSTSEQADSGAGLAAQRAAIESECARRGWQLVAILEDGGFSGKNLVRPALQEAFAMLKAGQTNVLMVSKVDRLSRSVLDFATVLATAERQRWSLVALDLGVDTTTPTGQLMANILAATAEYERKLIGQRTREGLAAKRAAGVRLGRPRLLDGAVADRIRSARQAGSTLQAIADRLNSDGVTTPTGRSWSPALVRKITLQPA